MLRSRRHLTIARPLGPEDLRRGTYVAILHEMGQHLPFSCTEDTTWPVATAWLPEQTDGPLRVLDLCLPFVCVREPGGTIRTLDVRRHRLAELDRRYARGVVRRLAAARRAVGSRDDA